MTFNVVLVTVAFEIPDFMEILKSKEIVHLAAGDNPQSLVTGNILDQTPFPHYYAVDLDLRRDENPFWYVQSIIDQMREEGVYVECEFDSGGLHRAKGRIVSVLINEFDSESAAMGENEIVDLVRFKLISL